MLHVWEKNIHGLFQCEVRYRLDVSRLVHNELHYWTRPWIYSCMSGKVRWFCLRPATKKSLISQASHRLFCERRQDEIILFWIPNRSSCNNKDNIETSMHCEKLRFTGTNNQIYQATSSTGWPPKQGTGSALSGRCFGRWSVPRRPNGRPEFGLRVRKGCFSAARAGPGGRKQRQEARSATMEILRAELSWEWCVWLWGDCGRKVRVAGFWASCLR